MNLTTAQKWRRTLAWLHRNFPTQHNIHVQSKLIKKNQGYTEYICDGSHKDGEWFSIKIDRKQCFLLRIDTLIHEWAHCLSWSGAETSEDHSAEWGIAYAKIYRTFIEWNWGRDHGGISNDT